MFKTKLLEIRGYRYTVYLQILLQALVLGHVKCNGCKIYYHPIGALDFEFP